MPKFLSAVPTPVSAPSVFTGRTVLINGLMRIAQRGTSFASAANGTYSLDRWKYHKSGSMVHTLSQDTSAPTIAQAGYIIQNSYRANLTTADTSIAAGDFALIVQHVEGYRWALVAQRYCTLSFWVKATATGVYCITLKNTGNDRSYVTEYTINTTNTWEKKVVVIPPSPSGGTWDYINGIGVQVVFTLAAGSTYHTTAGVWQTGNYLATSNQINGVNTGATDFYITDVKLEPGTIATPASYEAYDEDFLACQRYYCVSANEIFSGDVTSSSTYYLVVKHTPIMRATPTLVLTDTGNASFASGVPTVSANVATYFQANKTANANAAGYFQFSWTADAEF